MEVGNCHAARRSVSSGIARNDGQSQFAPSLLDQVVVVRGPDPPRMPSEERNKMPMNIDRLRGVIASRIRVERTIDERAEADLLSIALTQFSRLPVMLALRERLP